MFDIPRIGTLSDAKITQNYPTAAYRHHRAKIPNPQGYTIKRCVFREQSA